MCGEVGAVAPRLGRRRVISLLGIGAAAALQGAGTRVWAQTTGGGNGHTGDKASPDSAHDRQSWKPHRKADEAIKRANNARRALVFALEAADEEGWCPKTQAEFDGLLDALACFLATRDIWRDFTYDVYPPGPVDFAAEFKGSPEGNPASQERHGRAEAMKRIFKDAADLQKETVKLIVSCLVPKGGVAQSPVEETVRNRVAQKKGHELALIGLAPLLVGDCPECTPPVRPRSIPSPIILGR